MTVTIELTDEQAETLRVWGGSTTNLVATQRIALLRSMVAQLPAVPEPLPPTEEVEAWQVREGDVIAWDELRRYPDENGEATTPAGEGRYAVTRIEPAHRPYRPEGGGVFLTASSTWFGHAWLPFTAKVRREVRS